MYGAHVIEEFQKRNCGPSKNIKYVMIYSVTYCLLDEGRLHFQDLMQSKRPFEISRTFAATLQLVSSSYNVM